MAAANNKGPQVSAASLGAVASGASESLRVRLEASASGAAANSGAAASGVSAAEGIDVDSLPDPPPATPMPSAAKKWTPMPSASKKWEMPSTPMPAPASSQKDSDDPLVSLLMPFILKKQCPVPGCKFGSFNVCHILDKDPASGPHNNWRQMHPMVVTFLRSMPGVVGALSADPTQLSLQLHRVAKTAALKEVDAQLQSKQSQAKVALQREKDGNQASSEMEKQLQQIQQRVKEEVAAKQEAAAKQEVALQREREEAQAARDEAEKGLAKAAESIQRDVSCLLQDGVEAGATDDEKQRKRNDDEKAMLFINSMLNAKCLSYNEQGTAVLSKVVRGERAAHEYGAGAFPSLADLRRNGLSVAEINAAGIDLALAHKAGFTLGDFLESGMSLALCRRSGFTAADAHAINSSCSKCVRAGYSWKELSVAGFSSQQLEEGVNGLKVAELKQILKELGVSEDGLKRDLVARVLSMIGQPAAEAPVATGEGSSAAGPSLPAQVQVLEASVSVLDDLELKQDLQAVELAEKLEEEKQARSSAEQARQAAADREAAAAALRATESFLGDEQALDAAAFIARFMAFRQYVEMLLKYVPTKTAKAKPWRMVIRRNALCASVLEYFQDSTKMRLFQSTEVSFVDASTGEVEEGHDLGGLTAEMYSCFFREMLLANAALFEGVDGAISIGLLPTSSASPEQMAAIGRIMCKCLLDDQPIGAGLGRFVFEYLADTHETRVFQSPRAALAALADYDAALAQQWAKLLAEPMDMLTLDMFDEDAVCDDDEYLPATEEAIGAAIIAGCRSRLLTKRERSLQALRAGFAEHGDTDLRIHLGIFSSEELVRMLRGNTELSAADLSGCFEWPDQAASAAAAAGFESIGSEVPRYLREIIEDEQPETALSSEVRLHILEWATALTALPCGGLKDPIVLKLYSQADENDLPNVHTCTHEVHLPAYSSREQLKEKLLRAVEHRHDGFHIE